MPLKFYHFDNFWSASGFIDPAFVGVDDAGLIRYLSKEPPEQGVAIEYVKGLAIPGMINAHSHAFQYSFTGHTESAFPDFWKWREMMYRCALAIDPDDLRNITRRLYAQMLSNGYTHVCEFHYLHHDTTGKRYKNPAELTECIASAAIESGIKLTLIPVYYNQAGFGKNALPEQRRFIFNDIDDYFTFLDIADTAIKSYPNSNLGYGVHSLRAAKSEEVVKTMSSRKHLPFHIHVAEQIKEVDECRTYLGTTPIRWLFDHTDLSGTANFVHCTQADDEEIDMLSKSSVNVILCPSTEANLADGFFSFARFHDQGGKWSIGSDSQVGLYPMEEIRWLDYGQRLLNRRRNILPSPLAALTQLFHNPNPAGSQVSQRLAIGSPLDVVVYRSDVIYSKPVDIIPETLIYNANSSHILGTLIDGKWIVKEGIHRDGAAVERDYQRAMKSLARKLPFA